MSVGAASGGGHRGRFRPGSVALSSGVGPGLVALTLLFLPPQCGGTRTRRDPRNAAAAAAAMASRKAAAAAQGNGLAAAGRDRAHLELAELGPLLEEKGEQGAAGTVSVRRPARHRVGPVLRD